MKTIFYAKKKQFFKQKKTFFVNEKNSLQTTTQTFATFSSWLKCDAESESVNQPG